eukprot:4309125-Prymnesium_polylepis.1
MGIPLTQCALLSGCAITRRCCQRTKYTFLSRSLHSMPNSLASAPRYWSDPLSRVVKTPHARHPVFALSQAFIKLKSLPLSEHKCTEISKLALTIFSRYTPSDPATRRSSCHNCGAAVKEWDARCGDCGTHFAPCIVSGRSILDPTQVCPKEVHAQKFHAHDVEGISRFTTCTCAHNMTCVLLCRLLHAGFASTASMKQSSGADGIVRFVMRHCRLGCRMAARKSSIWIFDVATTCVKKRTVLPAFCTDPEGLNVEPFACGSAAHAVYRTSSSLFAVMIRGRQ